VTADNVKFRTN